MSLPGLLYLTLHILSTAAYFTTVNPKAETCFYDWATSGTKMSLTFEVAEGGFLDIDVKVSFSGDFIYVLQLTANL